MIPNKSMSIFFQEFFNLNNFQDVPDQTNSQEVGPILINSEKLFDLSNFPEDSDLGIVSNQ